MFSLIEKDNGLTTTKKQGTESSVIVILAGKEQEPGDDSVKPPREGELNMRRFTR
jgi:hypothetical protein